MIVRTGHHLHLAEQRAAGATKRPEHPGAAAAADGAGRGGGGGRGQRECLRPRSGVPEAHRLGQRRPAVPRPRGRGGCRVPPAGRGVCVHGRPGAAVLGKLSRSRWKSSGLHSSQDANRCGQEDTLRRGTTVITKGAVRHPFPSSALRFLLVSDQILGMSRGPSDLCHEDPPTCPSRRVDTAYHQDPPGFAVGNITATNDRANRLRTRCTS